MAIFRITPATSVFSQNTAAFSSDTLVADSLIVDPGAFLVSALNHGAFLYPTGAWNVTVNGTILGAGVSASGIFLTSGNLATSTINVGADGEVSGYNGMFIFSPATITNAGEIIGTNGTAILLGNAGTHVINNSGVIKANIIPNYAIRDIDGLSVDKVTNSGMIDGDIDLSGGNDTLTNSGFIIDGFVKLGEGTNKLTNSGTIHSNVESGNGADTMINSGAMKTVVLGGGNDTLTNSNLIDGFVNLGDGTNKLTNSGTILGYGQGGTGVDTMVNSGTITSFVDLGSGNDVFTNFITTVAGTISGTVGVVDLGAGNDKFFGGNNAEIVFDGIGSDNLKLGGGDDSFTATMLLDAALDVADGGLGSDTYSASNSFSSMLINLDTIAHDLSPINHAGLTAAGTAISGGFTDRVIGFENAIGGSSGDAIYGNAAANTLEGGNGGDNLFGYGGNDTLSGGNSSDGLAGGAGKDSLFGGPDATDWFQYFLISDSTVAKAGRDQIKDFEDNVDFIDLSRIDANTLVAGDQSFSFIGTNVAFTGVAGQLQAIWTGNGQLIQGDINGNKIADFSIGITDPNHFISFSNGNFFL